VRFDRLNFVNDITNIVDLLLVNAIKCILFLSPWAVEFSGRGVSGSGNKKDNLPNQQSLPAERLVVLSCRDGETRTLDLVVPNDARYLAALHPEEGLCVSVAHKNNKLYRIDVRNNEQFAVFPT
jgi:hypothetical protein